MARASDPLADTPPSRWVAAGPHAFLRPMVEGNGAAIVLYRLEAGARFAPHSHSFAELGVVLAGRGRMAIAGAERLVREGDSFFIPPGSPHGFIVPKKAETVVLLNVAVSVPSDLATGVSAEEVVRLARSLAHPAVRRPPASR